jgi:hypothetical protein
MRADFSPRIGSVGVNSGAELIIFLGRPLDFLRVRPPEEETGERHHEVKSFHRFGPSREQKGVSGFVESGVTQNMLELKKMQVMRSLLSIKEDFS